MNIEALDRSAIIEAVTAEVIKRLGQSPSSDATVPKKLAVLLATEPMPEMESLLGRHFEVRYFDESLRDCDVLIIPKLCLQLLSNLANGISAGQRERFILTMLLKGRRVVALEEGLVYRKYKSTAPVLLYKQFDEFSDKLSSFGIRMVKTAKLLSACLEDGSADDANPSTPVKDRAEAFPQPELLNLTSKVVTESQLKKYRLYHRKEIGIDRHSIITPLAQDYLRMQQIRVHRT